MISGVLTPNQGNIYWQGKMLGETSPKEVRDLGIETVYQDLALADNLEVPANLFLGKELTKRLLGLIEILDKRTMETEAREALKRLNIELESSRIPVRQLSGGQRQAVAIGRALYWNARLFIMDEPTAALGVKERNNILKLVKLLKGEGISVILISHNLSDIFAVTDRILIMRRGNRVCELETEKTDEAEVVRLMIGLEEGVELFDRLR
jgi:simple sugar transport system ATP-binding protein